MSCPLGRDPVDETGSVSRFSSGTGMVLRSLKGDASPSRRVPQNTPQSQNYIRDEDYEDLKEFSVKDGRTIAETLHRILLDFWIGSKPTIFVMEKGKSKVSTEQSAEKE